VVGVIRHSVAAAILEDMNAYIMMNALMLVMCVINCSVIRSVLYDI